MNRQVVNLYAFIGGLLLAVVLCFPGASQASTYWQVGTTKGTLDSVAAWACDHPENWWPGAGVDYTNKSVNRTVVTGASPYREAEVYCNAQYFTNTLTNEYLTRASEQIGACPVGTVDYGDGICVTPNPCRDRAGQVVSSGMYDLGTDENALPPTTTCDGQCELSYSGSGVVARQMVGGAYHYFSEGSYTATATQCATSDALTGSTALPPPSCDPATQDSGTVNGKFVCLNKSTTKTTTESPPVTNPDGSTTQTTTTTDSATGTDTVTTTTTAPDGTKTSTTTTMPTPGTSTNFCQQHPADPSCTKDDIPWGDVPEAGLIPTHEVPVTTAYTVIGGEGQCPADQSVSFLGQSITWSYAPLCTFAEAVKPLVIGLAWLSFGFIIVGGLGRAK